MKSVPRAIYGCAHLYVIALLMWGIAAASVFAAGGDLDTTFDPGTGAGANVRAVAVQSDGRILIGGAFTSYNGVARNRVARLNADGSLDDSFDPGTGASSTVNAIAVQPDGRIIIGGEFTSYAGEGRNRIARLNPNGSLDTSFTPGSGASGSVNAVALQPDGKIIIGGTFATYNGTGRNRIARLFSSGPLDNLFDPGTGANDTVNAIVVRPNGQIVIGGAFTMYNDAPRNRVARLDANGSREGDSGTGADASVFSIALYTDGRVIIGGAFTKYNNIPRNRIARITPSGLLDTSFDPGMGADGSIFATALQPDGKLIIAGFLTTYKGVARRGLARVNEDGSLDTSFDPGAGVTGGNSSVNAIAVQPDGKIIIGGDFTTYNGVARRNIARLLPAPGALSFSASANSVNEGAGNAAITLTRTGGTDNKVTAKVTITDGTASPADYIFAPGALDTSFDPGTGANVSVFAIAVQTDGKILIGGPFTMYNGVARSRIARLNANGSLDTAFDPGTGANESVSAVALQPDGKIIIAGAFNTYNGVTRNGIARLNADGSLDITFDPASGPNEGALAVVVQPDGQIIVVGFFSTFNGAARNGIARLNANGSLDMSFNPGTGANEGPRTVALQPDGRIIIGGFFDTYNGVPRSRIARLNANGSLDTTFDPGMGANNLVDTVALQTDGKIIIGGFFTTYNGVARSRIARLNANGSLDITFDPGTGTNNNATVRGVAMAPDGKIIAGGNFTTYNGVACGGIARINTNGSLDTSFDPGTGVTGGNGNAVYVVAAQPDGKIIIGGDFTIYNGVSRGHIARVGGDLFVTWPAGDAADKTIQLPIVDNSAPEGNETLTLTLTNLTGGASTGANSTQTLTIIDNDTNTAPVANDQAVSTSQGAAKPITLTGSDAEGNALTFTVTTGPRHGTLSGATPTFTYSPGANYSGRDSFTFKANDGQVDSTNSGMVTILVQTTFAQWQQRFFTPQELTNAAISGDLADPDGDGLTNLLEYALQFDPRLPSPSRTSTERDATYLSLIYARVIAATDLTYAIERSSDLISWATVIPVNVILSEDDVTQTIKAQVPIMGATEMFLRLRVSR